MIDKPTNIRAFNQHNIEVEVSNTQSHLSIDELWLIELVRRVLASEGIKDATISLAIVDDASIRVINAHHLSHDWATDVISFRFSEDNDPQFSGELVVSAEMAVTTALEAGCHPRHELALYMVHGLLHLCGYDDQAAADVAVIRRREAEVLTGLRLENPFDRVAQPPVMSDESDRESVCWPR